MHSDIQSANVTATGTVYAARARIKGLHLRADGIAAGKVVLRDGGASGAVVLTLDLPSAAGAHDVTVPDNGILCGTDIHATLTNVDSLTVFYDG